MASRRHDASQASLSGVDTPSPSHLFHVFRAKFGLASAASSSFTTSLCPLITAQCSALVPFYKGTAICEQTNFRGGRFHTIDRERAKVIEERSTDVLW